jgi:hypothetical protein
VRRQSIPDQNCLLSAQLPFQIVQENDQALVVVAAWPGLKPQPASLAVPAIAECRAYRQFLPVEGLNQHRSLPFRCPGSSYRWPLRDSTFVLEDNPGTSPPGVFFIAGHRFAIHSRRPSSLRSRARLAGRCRLHSKAARIFHTCPG